MNAVVVHDGAIHPGGAVDVALETVKALEADLVVGFSGVDRSWWKQEVPQEVRLLTRRSSKSFLSDARVAWKLLKLELDDYDVVFTSGPAAKFYQPTDAQRVYHYLHHPPLATLWRTGGFRRYIVKMVDRIETWSVQYVIANSELTADRMRTHYNRSPDAVIYPPVTVDRFSPDAEKEPETVVLVGRLEERKRPAIAVEAFRELLADRDIAPHLHVIGDGPLRSTLERGAPSNVTFHGYVDDDEVVSWIERASVGLFLSRREDFGIVPIEYMAAGTPVVGVDEPFTNQQVEVGATGVLVEPSAESVADGIRTVLTETWDRSAIREQASRYDSEQFRQAILAEVTG